MKIFTKTSMVLGNGTVVERKVPVHMVQLNTLELQHVNHIMVSHPPPIYIQQGMIFLDVDGTVYLGPVNSRIGKLRLDWLQEVLRG